MVLKSGWQHTVAQRSVNCKSGSLKKNSVSTLGVTSFCEGIYCYVADVRIHSHSDPHRTTLIQQSTSKSFEQEKDVLENFVELGTMLVVEFCEWVHFSTRHIHSLCFQFFSLLPKDHAEMGIFVRTLRMGGVGCSVSMSMFL